jgi:hypothetical protein
MEKEHQKAGRREYEKPTVTVIKLQIEERLMACQKQPGSCKKPLTDKFSLGL